MNKRKTGRLVIIGGGNMGAAFARGLAASSDFSRDAISVIEPDADRRSALAEELLIEALPKLTIRTAAGDTLILAIKPQIAGSVCADLQEKVSPETTIISLMAGFALGGLEALFPQNKRLVRAMPNLPARIGCGVTAFFVPAGGSSEQLALTVELAERILQSVGIAVRVLSEEQVDMATAISGSGPAYIFYLVEAMTESARKLGLPAADARLLVEGTLHGAAALLRAGDASAADLRDQVTSKGGTTAAALAAFDRQDLAGAVHAGIRAAFDRAREISSSASE